MLEMVFEYNEFLDSLEDYEIEFKEQQVHITTYRNIEFFNGIDEKFNQIYDEYLDSL